MTMNLRSYQRVAVTEVRRRLSGGGRSVCLVAPTGSGKTIMGAALPRDTDSTLMIVHRRELRKQGRERMPHGTQVHTVQTLLASGHRPKASLVLWDECFPAGTLVDGRPIESIVPGDSVWSIDHDTATLRRHRVTRTFQRSSSDLVRVETSLRSVVCTGSHPFFVRGKGYVAAVSLASGDMLCMRARLPYRIVSSKSELLSGMPGQTVIIADGSDEQEVCFGADVPTESDAPEEREGEGVCLIEGNGAWPEDARGQREAPDQARAGGSWSSGVGFACCCSNRAQNTRNTYSLQTLRRQHSLEASCRGGRAEPLLVGAQGTGQEERGVLVWARVDCVSRIKQRPGRATTVYNLEVARSHTYFADGFLVHNCHHYARNDWGSVRDAYPDAVHVGLTATPERPDGKPLDMYGSLVVAAQYSELLSYGYLVDCDVYMSRANLAGDRFFVFADSVTASRRHAEGYERGGFTAASIDVRTPKRVRDAALESFRAGRTTILCNFGILTEGIDIPEADGAIVDRDVDHVSQWLQMAGRILRPSSGKLRAKLIDPHGNVLKHGLPTEDRIYSLSGRAVDRAHPVPLGPCKLCRKVGQVNHMCCGLQIQPLSSSVEGYMGRDTASDTKERKWRELIEVARAKGWSPAWAQREFKRLFGESRPVLMATREERVKELRRLEKTRAHKGWKRGYVTGRFHALFGSWPSKQEMEQASATPHT